MPAATSDQQLPRPQQVFISYSRKDKEFVRRLHEALSRRGREAWVDWEDIRPTEEWMQPIYAAIKGDNEGGDEDCVGVSHQTLPLVSATVATLQGGRVIAVRPYRSSEAKNVSSYCARFKASSPRSTTRCPSARRTRTRSSFGN
jgi:TIR domain